MFCHKTGHPGISCDGSALFIVNHPIDPQHLSENEDRYASPAQNHASRTAFRPHVYGYATVRALLIVQ